MFELQNELDEVFFMESDAFSGFGELNPVVDVVLVPFLEVGKRVVLVDVIQGKLIDDDENEQIEHDVLLMRDE